MASSAPPRRFNVEPIGTSVISSKDKTQEGSSKPPRRFAPEPVETTTKTNRRFAPEPIETTTKTSRRFAPEPIETTTKTNRRFVPEPIETTARSSKDQTQRDTDKSDRPRPRRFAPVPIETSTSSNRQSKPTELSPNSSRKKFAEDWDNETAKIRKSPRKFSPQLVETAQRSRRAGDSPSFLGPSDKTEATPKRLQTSGLTVPSPPTNTPTFDYSQNPLFAEIRRATSPLTKRRPLKRISQRCFRVPDLDAIESSESEGSTPSSPITTAASSYISEPFQYYKEATRIRESVDAPRYLLELAAEAAEKQLREQAMAAFPNDDVHEHVDHFIDREDSLVEEVRSRRESSHHQINWEVKAMREHREKAEQQESEQNLKGGREPGTCITNRANEKSWNKAADRSEPKKDIAGGRQKDKELDCMRKEARPPMLGDDIVFPRCASPEPARFDTTQGCDVVKKAMCYLSEQSQQAEKAGESLWCGRGNGKQTSQVLSLWGGSNTSSRSESRQSGLWGGYCVSSGQEAPKCPSGILTPMKERGDPFSPCPTPSTSLWPPTPPASHADFAGIDEKLAVEATIDEEFGDDFVTQVYNYLSLGYPSMARPFDAELSKISGIPIQQLRQDDHLAEARGYIRLGEDGNLTEEEITEESCMRWRALRIYIREWAKQKPGMAEELLSGGMGTAVRRGSWGL